MPDVAAPAPGGPMKLASKRLKAVGRVVGRTAANHTSTRLRLQEKRNQEGKVTLARILTRLPTLRLAGEPVFTPSALIDGINSMPVEW